MSEEQGKPDVRGTVRDWPAGMLLVCGVVWLGIVISGGKPTWVFLALAGFAVVAWLVRAGKFSPRQ